LIPRGVAVRGERASGKDTGSARTPRFRHRSDGPEGAPGAPPSMSSHFPAHSAGFCELIDGRAEGTVTFHGASSRTLLLRARSRAPSLRNTPEPVTSPRAPGRLGHGHSLPGPWPRRPRPFPSGGSFSGPIPHPPWNRPPSRRTAPAAAARGRGRRRVER
jgi:hypothetical protein